MKPFEQQTYYELLEVPVTAPGAEIRAAFERALETYSPDSVAVYTLVDPGQLDSLRARLTEAMEILTEPELRDEYDQMIGVKPSRPDTQAAPAQALALAPPPAQEPPPAGAVPGPRAEPAVRPVPEVALVEAPSAESAPAAPVAVEPTVSPQQVHAAFRSYALSYVPLLVPAPAPTGAVGQFASSGPVPAAGQGTAPEASPPEPAPAAAAAPPEASPVAKPPEEARETAVPEAEPVARVAAPAPVPEPVAAASVPVPPPSPHEEVSGVGAPLPQRGEPSAPPAGAARPAPGASRPERGATPPPLPPNGRRFPRPASPEARNTVAEPGKGPAAAAPAGGRNLGEAQQLAQESAIATAEAALAVVAAKAREPRPKAPEIPPNTEFNGEVLRQVREGKGLTLHQLAERTRISAKHLENVEADRYAALPATVYLRGFLMSLARELGLDPLRVSRSYLNLASGSQKK
jgi:hypothetical protein